MSVHVLVSGCCLLASLAVADPLWVRTYSGPDNSYDEVHAIGVDDSGNVIVSGFSELSSSDAEFVTIKYKPNGDTAWLRHFNPGSGLDGATALAVDHSGNVVVTGYLGDPSSEFGDWVTIKYSAAGESVWARIYDAGDRDRASCVVVDSAGNCYVTGRAGWLNDLDYVVVKYDPDGNEVWVFQYTSGNDDGADVVAVDEHGYTYVTGYTLSGGADFDILTWKLGPGGDSLWANVYADPAGEADHGMFAAVDPAGNLVVVGVSNDSTHRGDFITIKYSPAGETLWTRRYAGPAGWGDLPAGVAVDAAGCVYVTGTSQTGSGTTTTSRYVTIKYGPDGAERWAVPYEGPTGHDGPCAVALDAEANVYVSGSSTNASNSWDVLTIKYDSAGNQQWLERFDMPSMWDEAYVMALSSQGTVFIGGRTDNDTTGINYLSLAYGAAGAIAETPQIPTRHAAVSAASIVCGVLFMPQASGVEREASGILLDASGRNVLELDAGPNDVSGLAPGVYFVTARGVRDTKHVHKVVINH